MNENTNFYRLVEIMRLLRSPGGCPWDAEQTHESLKRYLVEETYEVIEAIDSGNPEQLKEELGDLMLQPVFHAAIAAEKDIFTIEDVIETICEKLIRRHPHVFGDLKIGSSAAQIENWERIKEAEKGGEKRSALSGVPPGLPALLKAQKISEKAARAGFDWDETDQVIAKVHEELHELMEAISQADHSMIEAELGDLLFAVVNLGRFLSLDPESALTSTISRFVRRFSYIEQMLETRGIDLKEASLEEMEILWVEAKLAEKG
ncbi:nucleoside triphosphate pyrophosphohydrolase [Geobacter sp. DSM 9736]|uniref:nucleoside triphosphate pyrophosphohydrolase n=1 Tax=Geobacter sp. DSM 9736 TaxID=1277350 RepID=UPI000B608A83|nr:nucleoside triphosphate pyrophosphohydrolase [Geobacter sp. DSM 9736]SNB46445.1 tetrapyrrole methylase family protein / MazG family protein [Geobacter sp. DSM 9736]